MKVKFNSELRRQNSQLTKNSDVKKALLNSYSEDRRVTGECTVDFTSVETCLKAYNQLEKLIQSDKRNVICNAAKQGAIMEHLKMHSKKNVSFLKCIQDGEIKISLSYCNFLIALHDLCKKHPKILQCALELRFIKANMKVIRAVVSELSW